MAQALPMRQCGGMEGGSSEQLERGSPSNKAGTDRIRMTRSRTSTVTEGVTGGKEETVGDRHQPSPDRDCVALQTSRRRVPRCGTLSNVPDHCGPRRGPRTAGDRRVTVGSTQGGGFNRPGRIPHSRGLGAAGADRPFGRRGPFEHSPSWCR